MQIVSLEEADVGAMDEAQVNHLAASLLPDSWLSTPRPVRLFFQNPFPDWRRLLASRFPFHMRKGRW